MEIEASAVIPNSNLNPKIKAIDTIIIVLIHITYKRKLYGTFTQLMTMNWFICVDRNQAPHYRIIRYNIIYLSSHSYVTYVVKSITTKYMHNLDYYNTFHSTMAIANFQSQSTTVPNPISSTPEYLMKEKSANDTRAVDALYGFSKYTPFLVFWQLFLYSFPTPKIHTRLLIVHNTAFLPNYPPQTIFCTLYHLSVRIFDQFGTRRAEY